MYDYTKPNSNDKHIQSIRISCGGCIQPGMEGIPMNDPSHYAYKIVCVDETNPLEYEVLEDVNVSNLEEAHKQVVDRISRHNIINTKWILLPIPKRV